MPAYIDRFETGSLSYSTGDRALIRVRMSEAVIVDTRFGVPILALSNGSTAQYVSGSGTEVLEFEYIVDENDLASRDLRVVALAENDGTIVSTSASPTPGVAADVSVRFLGASANNDILGPSDGNVVVNTNALSTGADLVAPKVVSMSAISGAYQVGAVLDIKVSFNEVVVVDAVGGVPTLTLSAGGIELPVNASYVSGTGTKSLTFRYEISEGDPVASGLDVTRINFNGGSVTDLSGNVANVAVIADQNNLAPYASVSIDGESTSTETGGQTGGGQTGGGDVTDVTDETAAFIEQIQSVSGDGTFKAGESVTLRVHLNEVVTVDTTLGSPILVLSNGGVAQYVSGSESDALLFKYTVAPTDRNTTDLAVLGLAENDALIYDAGGNKTDVRVTSENNLSVFNDVIINARAPYVRTIDAFDDTYIPGDAIDFTVTFSEAVEVLGTGSPVLELSNGGVAHYVSGAPSNTLLFRYTVEGTDQSSSDLDVSGLRIPSGSELVSISSQNAASTVLKDGILSLSSDVEIDTVLPQGTVSLSGDHLVDGILRAGESATVTVIFAEPVENPRDAITVRNGTLSDLVTDETAESGLVWKGTFTPSLNIESAQNALVLDNSAVRDASGNAGLGLSTSLDFAIDTVGPSARMSSQTLENGKRLFTLDFEEDVSALETSFLAVSGGKKGVLTKVSESVYTLLVEPLEDNSAEEVTVTLMSGAVTDLAGNSNSVQTVVRAWDETPPRIVSMSALDGSYTSGDAVDITVTFNEVVDVSTAGGVPVLALDNGRQAHYVSGSGSATGELVFRYMVEAGDEATDLDVLALVENGGGIQDRAGNPAYVAITPGVNNLASDASIVIDGVVPSISTISAADGLYTPGDLIEIEVQFSEAVDVDETAGSPILALSNGAYAQYVGGSGTSYLQFEYEVALEDNDATDLDVLGFAENGAVLTDASGNAANVTIRSEINSLSYRSDVSIDSALPQIAEISANEGRYKAGDVIEIAVALSKGVAIDTTQGEPSLELSNGSIATYTPELSSTSKLVFTYVVTSDDTQTDDLQVADFRDGNATFVGLISGGIADMSLPDGAMSSGAGVVGIDLTPPEVVEIAVADTALQAGESTTVTVTLNEPVKQLDVSFFSVDHGTLSAFESADGGVTWTSTYRPVRDIEDGEVIISLDGSKVSDEAGNLGSETAQSEAFNLDSLHPTIALRADHEGIANGPVRFVLNFSESVSGFSAEDLTIENGTLDELSFEGPDAGRPVGEYSFIVAPLENSVQPIKVRVGENKAFDLAGNGNALSPVYVQPVDTLKARIESIESPDGAYKVGDLINLDVTFSEAVSLHLKDGISEHELPELFLNNGQTAQYVAGSDSAVWTFQYQVTEVVDIDGSLQDIDVDPLKVLGLLENDTFLLDQAGNRTIVDVASDNSNGLAEGVVVDTTAPVITSFSAIDSAPYVLEDIIYIRAHLSEVVDLDFSAGRPVLELSNGGRASYVSGAGSKGLLFKYVVSDAETDAADLGVTAFDLNGALALDLAGNSIDGAISTANDLSTSHNVQIDTTAPELSIVRLVEDAGTVTDVVNDGYYKAGTTLAFDVDFDDVVRVDTTNGSPQLTLSNGQVAQYVGGSESATLRFEYTVQQSDINTRSLKVVGLSEQGSVITDHAGNSALVEITDNNLQYNTAVIDTKEIAVSITDSQDEIATSVTEPILITLTFNEPVDTVMLDENSIILRAVEGAEIANSFGVLSEADETTSAGFIVANSLEQISETQLTFEVLPADMYRGEFEISLSENAVTDLAGNGLASEVMHRQAVDTLTTSFEITPVAGPFVGSNARVVLYRENGSELTEGQDYRVDYDTETQDGRVQITLLSGYRGPMLIEVEDTSSESLDYQDELTKQRVSLDTKLRTMVIVDEPAPESAPITLVVTPLTELAVRKAGIGENEIPTSLSADQVRYNDKVADLFGLSGVDITRTAVTTTLDAAFNAEDGLDASESYGKALATLTVKDSDTGSVRATIEALVGDITEETSAETSETVLAFGSQTAIELQQAENVIDLMQDTAVATAGENALEVANALKAVIRTAAGDAPFVTEAGLTLLGVQGVDENTIGLAHRLLQQTSDDGSEVDTRAKIDGLLSEALVALSTIATAAQNDTAAADITHAHYSALGYAHLEAPFEQALASVLDQPSVGSSAVNSIAKIESLIATYQNLIAFVVDPETAEHVPTFEDYAQLGISGISTEGTLAVLNDALSNDSTLKGFVMNASQLQDLVDDFIASMDQIRLYSVNPSVNADLVPTFDTYNRLRLTEVEEDKVDALNSFLADPDVVMTASDVRNETQTLIDTYNDLTEYVSEVSGAVAPTLEQYATLGVHELTDVRSEAFLASYLPELEVDDIATASKLTDLADAVNALFYTADLAETADMTSDVNVVTGEQLALLGQVVNETQLASVQAYLALKSDTDVGTIADLTQVIEAVLTASDRIKAYAIDPTQALDVEAGGLGVPSNLDYEIVLTGTGVSVTDVAALNDVLADPDVIIGETDLQSELKTLVETQNAFFEAADGIDNDGDIDLLDLDSYAAVGVNGLDTSQEPAVTESFINSVIDEKLSSEIDQVSELQAIADAVIALRATITNGVAASPILSIAHLMALGVAGIGEDEIASLQTVLARDAASHFNNIADISDLAALAARTEAALVSLRTHDVLDGDAANNPSVETYHEAGVQGVTEGNLLAVNAQVRLVANQDDKNSLEELQALVSAANDAIAYISTTIAPETSAPVTVAEGEAGMSLTDQLAAFSAAGITGVSEDNLLAVNAQNRLVSDGALKDSVGELQDLVSAANDALAYIVTVASETVAPETLAEGEAGITLADQLAAYSAAGIQGVDADNLLAVNAQFRVATDKASVNQIQAIVALANTELAQIEDFAAGETALVATDYSEVGVTGVSADNLAAVNAQVLLAADTEADSVSEIQGIVTAANDALAYIVSDIAPLTATDVTDAATQITAYEAAGITGVTADNLLAVNAQIRKQLAADNDATDNLETVAEIQSKVAAANTALAYLVSDVASETYALDDISGGEAILTTSEQLSAYAEAGILNVTADNLLAVNAQMRRQEALDGNTDNLDSVADLQAQVSAADAALAYLTTTIQPLTTAPAAGTEGSGEIAVDDQLAAYAAAGVRDVTADNLLAVNAQLRLETDAGNKDSVADLQSIVAKADAAIAKVEQHTAQDTALTVADYEAVGVTGVADAAGSDNLAAVNAQVLLAADGDANSVADIQALVAAGNDALSYLTRVVQTHTDTVTLTSADQLAAYGAAGVTGVSVDNLLAVNAQLRLETDSALKDSVSELEALVTKADAALALIEEYNNGDGSTVLANGASALTVVDYEAAGITGVSATAVDVGASIDGVDNLAAVNAQVLLSDTGGADSIAEIQALVTAGDDALSYLTTTIQPLTTAPAAGSEGVGEISVDDQLAAYGAAGVTGVSADNLLAVNAQLRLESSAANKNSVSEIEALVVKADAALAYLTTTIQPLTTAPAAGTEGSGEIAVDDQLAAYAAAGVRDVTADNLLAVNAQLRLETDAGNKDSVADLQSIVAKADAAIAKVELHTVQDTALTVADYEAIGVTGVADAAGSDNLAAVNAQVLLAADGDANSVADIQALVTAGNDAIAYVTATVANEIGTSDASTGTLSEQAQLDAYTAAGITGVTSDNLLAVNAQLRLESTVTNKDSVSEIQAIVAKADAAIALIEEYNNGDGSTVLANGASTLTVADYEAAGITGVSDTAVDVGNSIDGVDNLAAVNAQVLSSDIGGADSIAEIQALVTAGDDALTYLTATIQPLTTAPAAGFEGSGEISVDDQLAAYAAAGMTGVSADNLLAVNAQLRLETAATNKNSVSEIEALVVKADAALALIEEYNNGDGTTVLANSATSLTIHDYEAAGIVGVDANTLFSVNRVILGASTGGANSVDEIQALANTGIQAQFDALAKISAFADTLATSTETVAGDIDSYETQTLSIPTLTANAGYTLKLGNVILESGALDSDPSVAELIAALQSDAAYTLAPFTVAAHSTNANDLVITFKNVGERNVLAELRSEMPTLVDYENSGATGATAENLYAANDSLMARTATQADSTAEVQSLLNAAQTLYTTNLNKILDYAEGTNTVKPSVRSYKLAGLTAVTEASLSAVNKIVDAEDSSTINDFATAATYVNNGVQAYEAALLKLADYANEVANAATPDLTDYETAGITGLQAGDIDMINALMIQRETETDGLATTTSGIQSIVNQGLAAIFKIRDAAQNNTAVSDGFTAADYEAVGVPAADLVNVGALNDALDSVAVMGADVRAYVDLMKVVDAVKAVDALADGSDDNGTVDLTAADFVAMGVTGVDTTTTPEPDEQVARLAILNDVLDRKDNTTAYPGGDADEVAEVQALHDAAQAVLRTAKGETPKITEGQLELLGFGTVSATDITADNLSAIQQVLINTYTASSDFTGLNTLAKIETLTKNAVDALDAIKANAAVNTSTDDTTDTGLDAGTAGLDAADFAAMGASAVTDSGTGSANNLAMVLSVLDSTAITAAEVTTYEQVQAIVDSVNTILTYVETGANAPKISDFTTLGLANITTADQLTLINSYLNDSNTTVTDIDSYDELQTRITAVNHILADAAIADLVAEEGIDDVTATYVATSADLEALGFTYVDTGTSSATLVSAGQAIAEVTPENIDSIRLAIANSADDLSELQTFGALKTLIEDTAKAANTIQAYGAADSSSATPVPTVDDYAAIGVAGVTSLNLAAINSSLAETGVLDTITASVAEEAQDIVNTWAKVQALADGETDTISVVTASADIVPTIPSTEGDSSSVTSGGFTVTSDSPQWNVSRLFDDGDLLYASGNALPTITIAADDAYIVSGFTIDDGTANVSKQWTGVSFQGSLNNSDWDVISTQTANGSRSNTKLSYNFSDTSPYSYFRFVFTSMENTNLDVGELEIIGYKPNYTVYTTDSADGVSDSQVGKDSDIVLLTSGDFASIGIKSRDGSNDLNTRATELLNQLIDERGLSAVDDTSEIKALAAAIEALLLSASKTTSIATPVATGNVETHDVTEAQLQLLGFSLVDSTNYSSVLQYLTGSPAGDGYETGSDHIAQIRADLLTAITGLSEIEKAAELNNATDTYPLASHWATINALTGATADDVASTDVDSFNSMLNTQAVDGVAAKNATATDGLLSRITDYNAVLGAADGGGSDSSLALTADEYARIGITGLEATSGQSAKQAAKLTILNDVIEGLAKTKVDTIPELQQVFDAADALLRTIDGETPAITQAELTLLGFTGVTANNLSAIQKALSDVDTSSNYDAVDTLSEVTAIVDKAVAALAAISDAALDNDADTRTDGVDTTAGLTADDFVAMGVEAVNATNLPLVLSALNDADIDNTDIFNLATTQALVNAASKVVALAGDVSAPKLVASDLSKLGVDLTVLDSGNTQANAIAVLNDLIIADSTAQTAVADIQTLVAALGALIDDVAEATTASLDLATTDLATLGFDATSTNLVSGTTPTSHITTNNIQAIRLALSATADDLSDLTSLSDLQTLVDDTAKAANKIENYAEASSVPTDAGLIPTVADFGAIGVTGVDSTNLSAVLDAVANQSSITADINAEVQTLVNAYAHFIEVADGTDDDDIAIVEQDYTDLGITLSTDADVKAAQLTVLTDAYDIKSYGDIDTIAELQAIADAVESVLDTAKLDVATTDFTSNGVSIAELELLGIARVTNDNLASVRWILADTYNQAVAGAKFGDLDTLPEIQSLIANVVNALDVIKAYAADNTNPVPSVQTYTFAGVQGVTEDNLEAVNRQVDAAELGDVDTVVELETVVSTGRAAHLAVVNKIANYSQALATATSIESGDSSFAADGTRADATPAQQSLALTGVTLASDDVLTLRVGTTTLSSDPLAGTTAADLLTALQASANYSDAPFTLSLNGDSTALLLDWKVWGEVSDTATLRSEQPSLDDYLLAGLQIAARTNDGVTAENLYAVNADVEAAALTAVADDATVAQVKTLLDSVEAEVNEGILAKTTAFAKIEAFSDDTGTTAPAPTVADYALANIAGVTAENLLAVNTRLKAGNSTPGNALTELRVDAAVTDADARLAQFENNTPVAPATAFTKADYEAIGIAGVSDTVVDTANSIDGTDNLLAVNAQIARAATNDANSILDIQWAVARANAAIASIEAYNNGTLGRELTIDDYIAVGINGVVPNDIHSINEEVSINSALEFDSVSEIQGLVDSGKRSLQSAIAAIYRTFKGETPAITMEQLKTLGFSSVTDAEITTSSLSSIHKVMANYYLSDPSYLSSVAQAVSKTESLARTAIDALEALKANADANTSTDDTTDTGLDAGTAGLDAADFAAMGVSTVTDSGTGSANNLAMVLSVLDSAAITAAEVMTYEQVQAIVESVNTILTYVENGSAAPKIADFTTLGLTDITTVDQLTLMNSYLNDSATSVTDIDSYDALQARLTAVNHILADATITDLTSGQGIDDVTATYVTTFADLEALGFTYVDTSTKAATLVKAGQATTAVTPENIDSIRLAIGNSANDLSELQSFIALKTLIEDTAKAANTIQAFGAGLTGAHVPAVADYAAIGVTGVTSLNLNAINSSLAETGVLDTITASVAIEVQDIVDTWAKVSALADGQNNVTTSGTEKPTASEWASLGLVLGEGVEEQVASLLGDILDPKVFADVQALDKLQSYVDALNALIKTTSLDYDSSTQTSVGTPDEGNGERADVNNAYITYAQLKLLGLGALDDAPRTINGISSPSSRYDDALEFVADGTTPLNYDWEGYKGALLSSISGLSKLEKVASLNSAVVANIATPDYSDYTAVGNFNPWGSQTGTVTLTNNWGNETLNRYQLISQTNDSWSFYRYMVNGAWTTWYRFDFVRNENGTVSGGWTSRGMSGNHNTWTPQFVNGRTDWYHNNLNVTVSASINQSNIDAVKVLNSVLNTEAIEDADTENLNTSLTIYRQIFSAANGIAGTQLALTADQYASLGIVGLEETGSQSVRQTAKLAILNEVIDGLAKTTVDTIPELQKVFDAVDALMRTIEGELPAITAAELSLLKFTEVNANNLSAIQKVLSDVDISSNYDAVDTLTKVKAIVSNAVAALEALKSEANANDSDSITVALLEDMGVEGAVDTGSTGANIALINSALDTAAIAAGSVDTLEEVQALVNVAAKVVALAGDASAPKLVASDLVKLGVNLTALGSGNTQANAIAVLNDLIIADSTAQTAVADIQTLVTALGALIDDVAEATATSLDLTGAALEALGFDATSTDLVSGTTPTSNITTNNIQAIRLALSATADDLSDLTSLSALQALVNDTAKAANKIENYAEAVTTPTDAGLIPNVEDFAAIGVKGVETNNLSAILNDLLQATSINNITADAQSIVSNHNQLGLDANAFISSIYVGLDSEEVVDSGVFYEDETPDIVLYLDSVTESDTVQLIVDGSEVNLGAPSADAIASGELMINNFNVATYDIDQNDAVRLQVQVSRIDGSASLSDEKDYFFG